MLHPILIAHQNKICIAAIALLLFLGWTFSFQKTFEAYALNRQLKAEAAAGDHQSGSLIALKEKKLSFYNQVLKGYAVKAPDRENKMWQTVSGLALYNQVDVLYDPVKLSTDTALFKGLVTQHFNFEGQYASLIKLVDTLHKTKFIGKIKQLRLSANKNAVQNKLTMQIDFVGIEQ